MNVKKQHRTSFRTPVEAFGEVKTVAEWARDPRFEQPAGRLAYRIAQGWDPDRALTQASTPPEERRPASDERRDRMIEAFGETKRVAEWVRDPRCAAKAPTLLWRLDKGWPAEEALTKSVRASGPHPKLADRSAPLVRRLRQGRLDAGLTTQVLGELIGVTREAVAAYEMGTARVPLGTAAAWAEAVGLRLVLTEAQGVVGAPKPLRPRQQQVLALVAEGYGEAEIAQRLGVSRNTAREYRDDLRVALGAQTSAHAVALGYQLGHLPDRGPQ